MGIYSEVQRMRKQAAESKSDKELQYLSDLGVESPSTYRWGLRVAPAISVLTNAVTGAAAGGALASMLNFDVAGSAIGSGALWALAAAAMHGGNKWLGDDHIASKKDLKAAVKNYNPYMPRLDESSTLLARYLRDSRKADPKYA